ncbi:hypothetical protein CNMCM6805_007517 [Aspergillus fumigatiaffinis]|uniref:Uncharacterized protein n=1 Tax=Aspergillus fumigatiaffinis TaxID=340414 RepID=A0A8H4GT23_9EURO|nr:hypothetical protein CNMCM5878_007094 [Aspergillus fumigatiaffinis]KAF4227850.1 hypothetical protein CNMCM6457_007249 [Aspergillus fumigatiaffinis]KAF4236411.1 hypothetical protein CNMCM6805_007517 [Aspergillus fumigatiaffinis]
MSAVGKLGPNGDREPESAEDSISSLEAREAEVHKLARRFTEQSNHSMAGQNPFAAEPERLWSPMVNTSSRAWCEAMLLMHTEDTQEVLRGHSAATAACETLATPMRTRFLQISDFFFATAMLPHDKQDGVLTIGVSAFLLEGE